MNPSRPEPVYRSEWTTIYHADARDVLPSLTTESLDLCVTDPPYGVEWVSNYRVDTPKFDMLTNDGAADRDGIRDVIRECVRLVGQKRHLYVFGPNDVLEGLKVSEVVDLVWDKKNIGTGNLAAPWGPGHEQISFAVSLNRHAGQSGKPALAAKLRKGSVISVSRRTGRTVRHPTEKPVALLAEFIESSSRIGETVLDPFAGSGSTGVAAITRGRRSVLVEVAEQWVELAIRRVTEAEAIYEKLEAC